MYATRRHNKRFDYCCREQLMKVKVSLGVSRSMQGMMLMFKAISEDSQYECTRVMISTVN